MGLPVKRSRKAQESDNEFEDFDDDMDSHDPTHEEDEDDDVDEQEEGEEGEGDEGEDSGRDAEMEELEKEQNCRRVLSAGRCKTRIHRMDYALDCLYHTGTHMIYKQRYPEKFEESRGRRFSFSRALWDKTPEFRFLVQKAFSSSNRLTQEPVRSSFSETDEGVGVAYSNLITSAKKTLDSLLGLQEFHRDRLCLRRILLLLNPQMVILEDHPSIQKHL